MKIRKIDVTLDNGREETLVFEPPVDAEQLAHSSHWRYTRTFCDTVREPIARLRSLCFTAPLMAPGQASAD